MAYTQRDADWVIQKAYLHSNRKATPPASGSTKYNALLGIVDSMQKLWEDEADVEWSSLYSLVSLAAVVTATDTFALHASINYISKRQGEYIQVTNGTNTTRFTIINPSQLDEYRYSNAVAKIGRNLKFSRAFTATSPELGYTIKVPSITFVDDIDAGADLVQVENPMWLAYMSGEEFIRQDIVKRNTKNDLIALAQSVMDKMKENNTGGVETLPMATNFIQNLE